MLVIRMTSLKTYTGEVEENTKIGKDLAVLRIQVKGHTTFKPKPGQYVMVLHQEKDKEIRRAYSLADYDHSTGIMEICLKKINDGSVSSYLYHIKPEETVSFMGPLGSFYLKEPHHHKLVFVATGTGIAPLYSMLRKISQGGTKSTLIPKQWLLYGCKTRDELVYHEWFTTFDLSHPPFTYIPLVSRESWDGKKGHVQGALKELLDNEPLDDAHFYICGLIPMVEDVKKLLLERGIGLDQIHYEKYF